MALTVNCHTSLCVHSHPKRKEKKGKFYTWTESGPKNVLRPNRSSVELERSRTRSRKVMDVWPGPVLTLSNMLSSCSDVAVDEKHECRCVASFPVSSIVKN